MKQLKIFFLAAACTSLTACNDMLDKTPLDSFSDDNFWTSAKNVEGYANIFYNDFDGYSKERAVGANLKFYWQKLSDDMVCNSFSDWYYKAVPALDNNWKEGYKEIRRTNVMLERIATMQLNDQERQHWNGVARMMRGWNYFQLVRMFGDVPLVMKSVGIDDGNVLYAKRTDRTIVMDSVLNDLTYAADNMMERSLRSEFSRALAQAIRAEVCLFEGTFCKYQPTPDEERSKRYLNACKESCQQLMSNSSYQLSPTYQENYNSEDLLKNQEIIFYKPYKVGVHSHEMVIYLCASTPIDGMSRDAFESYLFLDGKPLALTAMDTDDAAEYKNGHLCLNNVLANRDKRLAQTVDTCVFYNGLQYMRFNRGMMMTSSSGYGIQKFDSEDIDDTYRYNSSSWPNHTHAPIFWLARIYLAYAEACAELGTITQSDLDLSVNKLRKRAGLPNLTVNVGFDDPANNMGVNSLIWELRRERRVELMYDGERYWDLIRWNQLQLLDTNLHPNISLGANIKNDPSTEKKVDLNGSYIDGSHGRNRTFENKYKLFPIPSGQITLNPNLEQNEGWK